MRIMTGLLAAVAAVATVAAPGVAGAAPRLQAGAFDAPALANEELDRVRGTAPLLSPLTTAAVKTLAEQQARYDFGTTTVVARLVYDNWWNDVGSQLVVNNIPLR